MHEVMRGNLWSGLTFFYDRLTGITYDGGRSGGGGGDDVMGD